MVLLNCLVMYLPLAAVSSNWYETKRKWKKKEYDILKKINKMHFQSEFNETIQTRV